MTKHVVLIGRRFPAAVKDLISIKRRTVCNAAAVETSQSSNGDKLGVPNPANSKKLQTEKKKTAVANLVKRLNLPIEVSALLETHASKLARRVASPDAVYILHKKLANDVIGHTGLDLRKETAVIFEANPGPGIMTQALLKAGTPRLRVFEKRKDFLPYLQVLQQKYPNRLEIVEEDFLLLSKLEHRAKLNFQNTMDSFFKNIQPTEWIAPPPLKIFAVTPSSKEVTFLRFILAKLPRFESLYSLGRTEFFIFVSGKEYTYMTAQPKDLYLKYRSSSVLFQLLFDIKLLHKEPRDSFFPPPRQKKSQSFDEDHLYLIQLVPKKHIFDLVSPDVLPEFNFFVRHHLMKRTSLVAPALDQWIPGSGVRLIKEGLHAHAKFGELTPQQLLTLFLHFSSWPEYGESLFRTAARKSNFEAEDILEGDDEVLPVDSTTL